MRVIAGPAVSFRIGGWQTDPVAVSGGLYRQRKALPWALLIPSNLHEFPLNQSIMSTPLFETTQRQSAANSISSDGASRGRDDSVMGEHPVSSDLDYDAVIVGAGLSGILSLHRLRELGMRARVLEAGSAEGGTWFW